MPQTLSPSHQAIRAHTMANINFYVNQCAHRDCRWICKPAGSRLRLVMAASMLPQQSRHQSSPALPDRLIHLHARRLQARTSTSHSQHLDPIWRRCATATGAGSWLAWGWTAVQLRFAAPAVWRAADALPGTLEGMRAQPRVVPPYSQRSTPWVGMLGEEARKQQRASGLVRNLPARAGMLAERGCSAVE